MSDEFTTRFGRSGDYSTTEHVGYCDPTDDAIPNPGMGLVCYGYSDHMFIASRQDQQALPLDRATFDRAAALPHSDHIYLRYEWRDVQTAAGKLTIPDAWSWALEHCEKHGKGWSFRIMPAMPHSAFEYSLPEFLIGKFAMHPCEYPKGKYAGPTTKYVPAYDDEYLHWWGELLHLLADKFDGHPLLEFADISGFGVWGEWHSKTHAQLAPAFVEQVTRRLVDDHLRAFRKTPAAIGAKPSQFTSMDEMFIDAIRRGCWMRRDSFYPDYTAWEYGLNSGERRPGSALVYEPGAHPDAAWEISGAPPMDFENIYQRVLDIGSAYIGLGFNPWHAIIAHEQFPALLKRVEAQIGYRIRPAMVFLKRVAKKEPKWMFVGLVNEGVAPPPGVLTLRATFADGPVVALELPPGQPAPGPMQLVQLRLPDDFDRFGNGNTAKLELSLRIGQKPARPVSWAVAAKDAEDSARRVVRARVPYAFDRR